MKKKTTASLLLLVAVIFYSSCKKATDVNRSTDVGNQAYIPVNNKLTAAKIFSVNSNLVAYWPLDGNGTDLSGNGNTGTLYNTSATTDRFGNANGALSFNGTSSYIDVADNAALRLSGTDFTVNAWIKLNSYSSLSGSQIMSKRTSGLNNGWGWSVTGYSSSPTGVGFFGPGGGNPNAFGTTTVSTGSWHMITSVYNSSAQQLSIYIDGVYDNTTSSIVSPNGAITAALNIGRDPITGSYFFDGSIDEIRIYNIALDVTTISSLYTAPNPNGLIAYWSFDGDVKDYSGNGNNGTAYNLTSTTDRFGNANHAYYFDGSTSYVSVPDNAALRLNGTDITFNAWVKLSSYNSSYGSQLMSKRSSGPYGWGWSITGYGSSPTGVGFYGPGGGATNAFGTNAISTGSWHMITSVYNYSAQTLVIYIDGTYDSTNYNILSPNGSVTAALTIGVDGLTGSYFLQGALDDIRIYNKALTSTEIGDLYNARY